MARSRRPRTSSRTKRRKNPSPAPAPAQEAGRKDPAPPPSTPRMALVGIGASAGGLDAFTQLLHALPPQPGFAIVFVQHLAPKHDSALTNLLSVQTSLPVLQASDGMELEPNHVYVIPPNVQALMRDDGALSLL